MYLKVFLKLKKPYKLSLLGKYIKKQKKTKKPQKNPKKPTGLGFVLKNPGFFQPCLDPKKMDCKAGQMSPAGLRNIPV